MSSPADTPPPAAVVDSGFDPLVFWIQHRTKIVLFGGLLIVAVASYGVSEFLRSQKLAGAQALFAQAKSAEDYRKVIADYAGTPAAGDAYLLLAAELRKEGKLEESSTLLKTFTTQYPQHQLLSGAWTSLAANLEAEGKADEALAMYQKVSASYAGSFSAPIALLAEARLLREKGKKEEARKIYEQVAKTYAENPVAQQAAMELRLLDK
jgi:TolA-binding protein